MSSGAEKMGEENLKIWLKDKRGDPDRLPEKIFLPPGSRLLELLDELPLAEGAGYYTIMVNGEIKSRTVELKDGDEITIIHLPVGG